MTEQTGPVPADNAPGHQPDVVPDKPMVPPEAYRANRAGTTVDAADDAVSVRYAFRFEPLLVPFAAAVGVVPATAWVELDEEGLGVRFGRWSLSTSRDNIAACEVTGPYRFVKVAGAPHVSLRDRGVTFATSRERGACITFHRPVPGALPFGLLRHPAVTVTVTDPHDLARRLAAG